VPGGRQQDHTGGAHSPTALRSVSHLLNSMRYFCRKLFATCIDQFYTRKHSESANDRQGWSTNFYLRPVPHQDSIFIPKCNQLFRVCCECVIKLGKISFKKFFLQFFVRFILPDIQPTNKQTEAVDDVLEFRRSPFYWQFTSGTECIIFVVIMLIFVCRGDCVHKAGDECDT